MAVAMVMEASWIDGMHREIGAYAWLGDFRPSTTGELPRRRAQFPSTVHLDFEFLMEAVAKLPHVRGICLMWRPF